MTTKLILVIKNIKKKIKTKSIFFQLYFANGIFFLFFGFLTGNIFGSFLYIFRKFLHWDGAIILFLLCLQELISYFTYNSCTKSYYKQMQEPTLIQQKKTFFLKKIMGSVEPHRFSFIKKCVFSFAKEFSQWKNKVLTTCPYIIKNVGLVVF